MGTAVTEPYPFSSPIGIHNTHVFSVSSPACDVDVVSAFNRVLTMLSLRCSLRSIWHLDGVGRSVVSLNFSTRARIANAMATATAIATAIAITSSVQLCNASPLFGSSIKLSAARKNVSLHQ